MTAGRIDPNTLERVVAIFYYGRSGSVFLQSLFDSHPDVLTVPAEHLHDFYPFWSNVASLPAAAQVTAFCDRYDALFEPGPAHWGVEREAFSAALEAHLRDQVPDLDHDPAPRKFFSRPSLPPMPRPGAGSLPRNARGSSSRPTIR